MNTIFATENKRSLTKRLLYPPIRIANLAIVDILCADGIDRHSVLERFRIRFAGSLEAVRIESVVRPQIENQY